MSDNLTQVITPIDYKNMSIGDFTSSDLLFQQDTFACQRDKPFLAAEITAQNVSAYFVERFIQHEFSKIQR